jgi:hypothetical protein
MGPEESRKRGGSRPGLAKLCPTDLGVTVLIPLAYVDTAGDRQYDLVYVGTSGALGYVRAGVAYPSAAAELDGPDGVDIFEDNNLTIDFESTVTAGRMQAATRGGKVYFADTVLKSFDPATGVVEAVVASSGSVPTGETVLAVYRDRIFLAGQTNAWYCSRLGDPTDWSLSDAMEDPGRAIQGQLSDAAKIGDVVTAMVPIHDQALVMATENSLWVLRGGPTTGQIENVSEQVGIIGPNAWALDPEGTLVFLSTDGVYVWGGGSRAAPTRFSGERLPDELREVDASTTTISMVYDAVERGFHLFLTPSSGSATHWWIDVESKAFWPQILPDAMQPVDTCYHAEGGLGEAILACDDGYIRRFVEGQEDDDGTAIDSHVLIGPVRLSKDDTHDALLAELHGVMDEVSNNNGGTVTWRVVHGKSAAQAADAAKADLDLVLDGQSPVSVAASGTFVEGRNRVKRPRTRGAWVVLWLSSTERWSYEVVATVGRWLGRHR